MHEQRTIFSPRVLKRRAAVFNRAGNINCTVKCLSRTDRIPELDGIRALGAFAVIFGHIDPSRYPGGFIGVDIFFVLSGYLITSILANEFKTTGSISILRFYIRRALRLTPALWLMLFCTSIAAAFMKVTGANESAAFSMLYVMNWVIVAGYEPLSWFQHSWSLAIEEQFYLLWAPLLLIASSKFSGSQIKRALIAALGLIICWRLALIYFGASNARIYNGFDTHSDGLLIGAILAFHSFSKPLPASWAWVSAGYLFLLIIILPWGSRFHFTFGDTLTALATATIIANVISNQGDLMNSLLRLKPLAFLGTISYGLYLWHVPLLFILREQGISDHLLLMVLPSVTIGISTLSYYLVERPILRLRDNFYFKELRSM